MMSKRDLSGSKLNGDSSAETLLNVRDATLVARGDIPACYDGLFLWKLRAILSRSHSALTVDLRRVRSMPGRFYSLIAEAGLMAQARDKRLRILASGALAASLQYAGLERVGSIEIVHGAATRPTIRIRLPRKNPSNN